MALVRSAVRINNAWEKYMVQENTSGIETIKPIRYGINAGTTEISNVVNSAPATIGRKLTIKIKELKTVSYTHLTLPTICSV